MRGATGAHAQACTGAKMPKRVKIDGKALQLNGVGLREATLFGVDVYVAGLYLERRSHNAEEILDSDTVKHVRITFVRDVGRQDITSELGMRFRDAAGRHHRKLKARLDCLLSWLPALHAGDTLMVTYRPGIGLEVRLGARKLGTVPGANFARTMFGIWLGDRPPNPGLKIGLLGGSCG